MRFTKATQLILAFILSVFLLVNLASKATANLIDPNIKSTMKIIQLHVQLRTLMSKVDFDKNKFNNKMVFLNISDEMSKESNSILTQIKKEVDFLCNNLNQNKISPSVLLSIVSALKSNVYDIYHIYPFIKCLKSYLIQNSNLPEQIKKEITSLIYDAKATFGNVEHKIYNANIKRNPLAGAYLIGIAYGGALIGTYYASSQQITANNAPIANADGSVTMQEYDPWWLW